MTTRRRLFLALIAALGLVALPARTNAQVANWQKGMSFPAYWCDEYSRTGTWTALDQLAGLKANWIAIIPSWWMTTKSDNTIYPDYSGRTATDASVINLIQQCHARGLKVLLKPHVDQKDGTWRGSIQPTDPAAWFQSYQSFILHYAQIAAQTGAEQLCVGVEFATMTRPTYSSYWRSIVASIRSVYKGQLTYAGNWGGTTWGEYYQIDWWDALDFIGVDAYFPIANVCDATVDQNIAGWYSYPQPNGPTYRWVDDLKALSAKYNKKVIFTEIGFESNPRASNEWWLSGPTYPDMQAQVDCYEATFRVFDKEPWVAGCFWWTWGTDPNSGGLNDVGMWLNNKPAKDTVTAWYGKSATAADTTAPSTPSSLTAQGISTSQVSLKWGASTDNVGVMGYNIYRDGTRVAQVNALTYTDGGLYAATTYTYKVSAYDAAGNESSLSAMAVATTAAPADTTAPSVPSGLTVSPVSTSQLTLKWNASTDNVGVAGYNVYRNGLKITSVTTTSYADSGLTAGTSYQYQVAAYDANGNTSALCPAVTGTTTAVAIAPGYDFESGTQSWMVAGSVTRVWSDTGTVYQGLKSLGLQANSLRSNNQGAAYVVPPSTLVAGNTVTMQVYLESKQTNVTAFAYVRDAAGAATAGAKYALRPNGWTQISVTVPATAQAPLSRLGVQFSTTNGNYTGNLRVDDVRWDGISSAPAPPSSSAVVYGFEDGTTQGWDFAQALTKNWCDTAVAYEGTHSLGLWADSLTNSNMGYTSVVPPMTLGGGKTVSLWVYLEAAQTNVGAAAYVQDSAWVWTTGPWVTLKPNGWSQLQVTVPAGAKTPITRIGVQFACNTSYTGAIKIDAVSW